MLYKVKWTYLCWGKLIKSVIKHVL